MSRSYLDSSAALKLLVEEPQSAALAEALDESQDDLVACWLLETELRRAAQRVDGLTQAMVTELLESIDLYDLPASQFRHAGLLPGPHLRSLDAIHLASAVAIGAERVVSYDERMSRAAVELGFVVLAPR